MPRTLIMSPSLQALIKMQDGAVSASQLEEHGFGEDAMQYRVRRGQWTRPAPGVVITSAGPPSRRQLLIVARLWAGQDSAIDAADACAWYGVPPPWFRPARVHVVVPSPSRARSRGFVVVRRSIGEITIGDRGLVPYVDRPTALIAAARRAPSRSVAVAHLSLALQRRLVTVDELMTGRRSFGDKWCRRVDSALVAVGLGLRSPAEKQAFDLFEQSRLLPAPQWNIWLALGDGGPPVCVDALWEDAGLVAEINGRAYHAWAEQFESMHRRAARLTAAGLTTMHCTPRQLSQNGADILRQLEQTYARCAGNGLPGGVRRTDPPSIAA